MADANTLQAGRRNAAGPTARTTALMHGVAQWRDPSSSVRRKAREALRDGEWPEPVVEAALDAVLRDAEEMLPAVAQLEGSLSVLAIMPGNVIGPVIATSYCAAAVGATLMLKSSSRELKLADIVARQFQSLGPPVAGTLEPMRWSGGDVDLEAKVFARAARIIAFGNDDTIADIRRRAPDGVHVVGYGSAFSVAYVPKGSDVATVALGAAHDVAMFDQRGCLSPQTIYVEGDDARAILFGHALAQALAAVGRELPRAPAGITERAAIGEFIRRLQVRALPASSHALGTVIQGSTVRGYPEFVVGVEPFGSPICAGFGRLVVVKPCTDAQAAASAAATLGSQLDTIGVGGPQAALGQVFSSAGALRVCPLGEMQRPPLGYRPRIEDFMAAVRS